MEERKIRVAITQGDTNGIGYELIFKTFASPEMLELCTPIVYGSPKIAAYHRKALNTEGSFSIISNADEAKDGRVNLLTCFDDEVKVDLGLSTPESANAGERALQRALDDARQQLFDALVLSPLKSNTKLAKESQPVVIAGPLRMAFLTQHIALKDVAGSITEQALIEQATQLFNTLKRDLRFSNPRVALLALNPKAEGTEETEVIAPAVAKLEEAHVNAFGPYAADDFFGSGKYEAFEGVLAMYHDQGMAPLKALTDAGRVILYGGLPIVVTAPDVTPNFEEAGRGMADETTFRQAIYMAIDVCRNRRTYDLPLANPLPKLYHEKRDESEKVRFSIPKKHENSIKERL